MLLICLIVVVLFCAFLFGLSLLEESIILGISCMTLACWGFAKLLGG